MIPGILRLSSTKILAGDYWLYTSPNYDTPWKLETPSYMLNLLVVIATCFSSQSRPFFKVMIVTRSDFVIDLAEYSHPLRYLIIGCIPSLTMTPLETPSHMLNLFVVIAVCFSSQARPFFKLITITRSMDLCDQDVMNIQGNLDLWFCDIYGVWIIQFLKPR